MGIGHLLKLIRINKGFNQQHMADIIGISQNYLSLIESGKKKPSVSLIDNISKHLKISKAAMMFSASAPPDELSEKDKKDFKRLQNNITSLLLFELTGEIKEGV